MLTLQLVSCAKAPMLAGDANSRNTNGGFKDAIGENTIQTGDANGGLNQQTGNCLEYGGKFTSKGPYQFERQQAGSYIFYIPKLPSGCKSAAVGFAMGTGAPVMSYTAWYEHFASHGLAVVVDPNKFALSGQTLSQGIDTILETYPDILLEKAGTTGHSQGGGGAFTARFNSKISTVVGIQPGQFLSSGGNNNINYLGLAGTADSFGTFTDPKFMHYKQVTGPKFYANLQGANHIGSVTGNSEHASLYRALSTSWFRCYLTNDKAACNLFATNDCSSFGGNWAECSAENR